MRLLRRNALGIYGVYAASFASGLVVTPLAVNALGKTEYGVWSFVASLAVFLGLLDLGLTTAVVRFGAEHRGRGAQEETSELASAGLVAYGVLALVTLPLGALLAWLLPHALSMPDDLVWPARVAMLLLVVGAAARFPLGLFGNLLLAQQRFDAVNLGNFVSTVLYAVLVAAIVTQHGSVVVLAAITLGTTLLRLVLPLPWVRRELPALRLRRSLVTRERLRTLFGFGKDAFLIQLAAKIIFSADVIVVGIVLGADAAAAYGVPAKLFAIAAGAGTAGLALLLPAFSEAEGAEATERQRALLLSGLRVSTAMILLLALPLALLPGTLIEAWVGSGFGESGAVLALLAVALIVHQPAHVLSQYLMARGRQRAMARTAIAIVAVNLVLSIALATTVGLWGVALATVVTEAVAGLVVTPILGARAAGLGVRRLARAALRPVLPALAVAFVVLVVPARLADPDTLLELAPIGALWIAAFAGAVWLLGLSAEERAALRRTLAPARAQPAALVDAAP